MKSISDMCVSGASLDRHLTFVTRHNPDFKFDPARMSPVQNGSALSTKPIGGFWASFDNGWERWCSGEMPEWLTGTRYSVKLRDDARICVVSNMEDAGNLPRVDGMQKEQYITHAPVDFEALSSMCDGILIDVSYGGPGLYNEFYGWDCSSLCVFRAEAVTGLSPIEPYLNMDVSQDIETDTLIKENLRQSSTRRGQNLNSKRDITQKTYTNTSSKSLSPPQFGNEMSAAAEKAASRKKTLQPSRKRSQNIGYE